MSAHDFLGAGERCELLLEAPGYVPEYCNQLSTHPVHTGTCIHCAHALEYDKGDLVDVCRFCKPHYGTPPQGKAARCANCADGSVH